MKARWTKILLIGFTAMSLTAARAQDKDAVKKALAELQGEWTLVSGTNDGNPLPAGMLASGRRICQGNTMTLMNGTQVVSKAIMIVDPTKKPAHLDYQVNEGPAQGKKRLGIYEINGDIFKSNFGAAEGPRPKDFTSKSGEARVLTVWKRVKK